MGEVYVFLPIFYRPKPYKLQEVIDSLKTTLSLISMDRLQWHTCRKMFYYQPEYWITRTMYTYIHAG